MAKIDLDSLNIEELAALRDAATEKLAQKVAARQAELEAELESLSQYGKPAKKSLVTAPVGKPKKGDDAVRKELKALQGTWKAVSLEAGGKSLPKEAVPDFTFIIGADGKSIGKSPQVEYQATITVDPKKNPKTIDIVPDNGPDRGKTQPGIYEFDGDKLKICAAQPGKDRPTDFDTKGKMGYSLMILRREK